MNTGSSEKQCDSVTTLLMGFHCHQPVGNFDSVLRKGCLLCYGPLLEELARHEGFRFSIHMSGHLLEWIRDREEGIFDMLAGVAGRGQAEIFTAGFYEPVLSVIPPQDALEQIGLLSDLGEVLSGVRPEGLWLTERIWDPSLIPLLAEAGVRYTIVDDNHLIASGHASRDLSGYFLTETRGQAMALYPISRKLRYATPFKPVPEAIEAVLQAGAGRGNTAIVFDDGEKFGMWPDTADWVYGQGWLRDFLTAVCQREDIRTSTFRDHYHGSLPMGRVHLPPGSYVEMEEWTLTPEDAMAFKEAERQLEGADLPSGARRFLRGGSWPDFLVRYSESNNMHKKMLRISRRTREEDCPEARRSLFQGQCNDAYWHGIFGGLYLPVLRNGVMRSLNEAERILDEGRGIGVPYLADINIDGYREAELRSEESLAVVTALGGQVYELSDKRSLYNLLSTLTRRPEQYHTAAVREEGHGGEGISTIHESMHDMDEEVRRLLVYDRYPRYAFIDHFLPAGSTAEELMASSVPQWGDFASGVYELSEAGGGIRALRQGSLTGPGEGLVPATVEKFYTLQGSTLIVDYEVSCALPFEDGVDFACEVNIHPPSQANCQADLDGVPVGLGEVLEPGEGACLTIRDPALPAPVRVSCSLPASVWIYPVQTVSQSEGGFEVTWQGCSVGFRLKPGFSGDGVLSFRMLLEF